jgi:hypothetical protein
MHKSRKAIIVLTSKTVSLARKRNLLHSKGKVIGGFNFVPTIAGAALKSLGEGPFED